MIEKNRIIPSIILFLLLPSAMVLGAIVTFTITYSIPAGVSHTLSYGSVNGTCSSTIFYFREFDATIDGNQVQINVSDANSNPCQNNSVSGLKVNNNGNARINVTAELNQSALTGIVTMAGLNASSYQGAGCSRLAAQGPSNTTCHNITVSSPATIVENLGINGNESIWWWADFKSADLGPGVGVSGTNTRYANTNSSQTT